MEHLRAAIFEDSETVDIETRLLLAIAGPSRLLRRHFDKRKLKERNTHLVQIVAGNELSQSISKAVLAANRIAQSTSNAGVVAVAGMGS